MTLLKHLWQNERARHVLFAAALAALLGALEFFSPLKSVIWTSQAQIAPRQASGDIVFVEVEKAPDGQVNPQGRRELARLIDELSHAGARRIFVDIVFDRPSTKQADAELKDAIARSRRTFLTQSRLDTFAGERAERTLPQIAGSAPQVIVSEWVDAFGYVWFEPYSVLDDGARLTSLPAAIAGVTGRASGDFLIDYSIDHASIPTFTAPAALAVLSAGAREDLFAGKTLVLGPARSRSAYASIPGDRYVPPSIVPILAAETLKIGPPARLHWLLPLLLVTACLLTVLRLKSVRRRYAAYAVIAMAIPVTFVAFAHLRIAGDLATPTASLALFAILRAWHLRQQKASLVDELSGLPSFRMLERTLAEQASVWLPAVAVARIHRFDEVLSSLPPETHREYVQLIAERLRIADGDLVVYSNGGRYLAWLQNVEDEDQLHAHLTGLRALFAQPLHVAGTPIDVGITFGADATGEIDAKRKVASAVSVAEKTTEAHAPVLLAQQSSEADRLWNISIQAKIDQALKSGEIYVVYQPQFDLTTGALLGAEALVRWNDRERGHISPAYFIEQCELAGRMDALTRKVFEEAIESVSSSPLRERDFQLSINVSATLLHDLRVFEMLIEVLSSTALPPSRLTLEITETSRIADYGAACAVMDRLRQFGVRLSIDDFGVGAASLETLLLLPFDELKIDRMFVSRVRDSAKARSIVELLIGLSRQLGISVIAEGVEDEQTLTLLKEIRCDAAQGYFLGKPAQLELLTHGSPSSFQQATAAG
jgi:EAL domain-containing protein (putative c-di-GMP-specific phosphodiesterase class I)/GGDEF domain-containing protein